MLAQTLLIVAVTMTLGMALLTNGLISARAAFHSVVSRYADAALIDSVAQVTSNVRGFVQKNGTNGPWPSGKQTLAAGPVCDASVAAAQCPFNYQATWRINGSSSPTASPGPDVAQNLQVDVIDEQRLSAEVSVTLTSRSTGEVVGSKTRDLTFRVLRVSPYAVVSGSRDLTTVNGRFGAAQGDNGGTPRTTLLIGSKFNDATPDPAHPDAYHDTTVKVDVTCRNVAPISDPMNANSPKQNDGLHWGAIPAYEEPCVPPPGWSVTPAPDAVPRNMDYDDSANQQRQPWTKGDASSALAAP